MTRSCYICMSVIINFPHKGLRKFYESGDQSKLPANQVPRIRLMLTRLDAAIEARMMDVPGYNLHQLKGDMIGYWVS